LNPCHSDEARSAKEDSLSPLTHENIFHVIIMQFIEAQSFALREEETT
jgi:hypothetical protein